MVTKGQLNSTKKYLNKKIKELKEFIEQSNEENTWNLTETDNNKEILTTLPENEEIEAFINNYEDIYIERKNSTISSALAWI